MFFIVTKRLYTLFSLVEHVSFWVLTVVSVKTGHLGCASMSEKFRPMDSMATFIASIFIVKGCEFQLTDTQYDMSFFVKCCKMFYLNTVFVDQFLTVALRVAILIIYIFIGTRP